MRYFIIETPLSIGDDFSIKGNEANHIITVLRKKPRDIIGFFDKKGFEYKAVIIKIFKKEVYITITDKILSQTKSNINITLCIGFLKEKKIETLIKTVTELGITDFMPFISKRCIVKANKEKIRSRIIRWQKIAEQAIKQCKRAEPPKIYPPVSFEEIVNKANEKFANKIIFYELEQNNFNKTDGNFNKTDNWFVIIGPEGGFAREEIDFAKNKGFASYGFGSRILRSETAAVSAVTIIQFLYGDMGQSL